MHRRTVLGSIGAVVTLGSAGCVGTVSRATHTQDDSAITVESGSSGLSLQKEFQFELQEGEWAHKLYGIPNNREVTLTAALETGVIAVGLMTESAYNDQYRSLSGGEPGKVLIQAETDPYDDIQIQSGEDDGWVVVVDNTGYFSGHRPDGRAVGGVGFRISDE